MFLLESLNVFLPWNVHYHIPLLLINLCIFKTKEMFSYFTIPILLILVEWQQSESFSPRPKPDRSGYKNEEFNCHGYLDKLRQRMKKAWIVTQDFRKKVCEFSILSIFYFSYVKQWREIFFLAISTDKNCLGDFGNLWDKKRSLQHEFSFDIDRIEKKSNLCQRYYY